MKEKCEKIVEFVKTHKKQIIGTAAAGMIVVAGGVLGWKHSDAGKLISACKMFGDDKHHPGVSMTNSLTNFLNDATRSVHPCKSESFTTVADFGEDVAEKLMELYGVESTAKVSSIMIGVEK
jgi:hypothetical protein